MRSKFLLAAGALCALLSSGLAAAPASAAKAGPAIGSPAALSGTVYSITTTGLPAGETAALTVARPGRHLWSVALTGSTVVTMRQGGPTTYAALHVGDAVGVHGTVAAAWTLSATAVRDASLIDRAAGIVGSVRSIVPTDAANTNYQMVLTVGHRSDDGFVRSGQRLVVDLAASTPVTLANGAAGSIGSIHEYSVVRVAGIYDAAAGALVAPDSVRLLATSHDCDTDSRCRPRQPTAIAGWLYRAPDATDLRLHLKNGTGITVTVPATATLVRRYDGPATLSQFAIGDWLQVKGSFQAGLPRTFAATNIEDVSQQDAYTTAFVELKTLAQTPTGATFGAALVAGYGANAPYHVRQVITLIFPAGTTLADYHLGQSFSVHGRYDRESHSLIVM